MKKIGIVLSIIVVSLGAVFGYREIRRSILLSSERDVLLVNKKAGVYSFKSLLEPADITRAYQAVGYVDSLSDEVVTKKVFGLVFVGTSGQFGPAEIVVTQPESGELAPWIEASSIVDQNQRALCDAQARADFAQACMFRHYILQLTKSQDTQGCDVIYHEDFLAECRNIVENQLLSGVQDDDGDGLIDQYEYYADPESFDPDPLG